MDGFIPTDTSEAPGGIYFKGDNRDFSSSSSQKGSRFWVWIDTKTGKIVNSSVHPTQRASGANGQAQGDPYPPRNSPNDNSVAELFFGSNKITSSRADDGSITLNYSVVCSDPICNSLLAPNGSITFSPNKYGSYDTFATTDTFPNLEAYHWQSGALKNDYLFRIQNFSEAERQSGNASWISALGMANQQTWAVGFDSSNSRKITYFLSVDLGSYVPLSGPN